MKRLSCLLVLVILSSYLNACRNRITSVPDTANQSNKPETVEPIEYDGQNIIVTDGVNTKTLTIGVGKDKDLSQGIDPGADIESPPFTPPGAFYAYFINKKVKFFDDVRPLSGKKIVWALTFAPQEGKSITIKWEPTNMTSSLKFVDDLDKPKIDIDMGSKNSYSFEDGKSGKLYIVFDAENSKII